MIKDIFVPITGAAADASTVDAAIAIALHFRAHLAITEFVKLPVSPGYGWASGDPGLAEIYEIFRARTAKAAALWRERLAREDASLSSEVRVFESVLSESPSDAAVQARYADLTVLPMMTLGARDLSTLRDYFGAVLLQSGRPVLMVPPGFAWRPPRHVVMAWQARRESARALHDAMPFLRVAGSIDVVEVRDRDDGSLQGAEVATHLARQGLKVNAIVLPEDEQSVASTLVRHAQASGAELLVSGGYGHSRLREWAFGGVTRELVASCGYVPILFSH